VSRLRPFASALPFYILTACAPAEDSDREQQDRLLGLGGGCITVSTPLLGVKTCIGGLSSLDDEFSTGEEPQGWQIYRASDAELWVEDGALVFEPAAQTQWFATDEAVHVFKPVGGSFAVTARVEVTNDAGGAVVPGAPYRIGGLMIRNALADTPDTFHIGIGNMNLPEVAVVTKSTDDGVSAIENTTWSGTRADLRICRVGSNLAAYARPPGGTWTLVRQLTLSDLPSSLAVGPIAYAGAPESDLHVEVDYVRFQAIQSMSGCLGG
jgi:hypothetical protein